MSEADELTEAQIESLRALLLARREEVEEALSGAREEARPVGLDQPIGRLTRMDAIQQQHMAAARIGRLETQLAQIKKAQSRIDQGTYGECARCEEPIAYKRLAVQPETPFCLRCQRGTA